MVLRRQTEVNPTNTRAVYTNCLRTICCATELVMGRIVTRPITAGAYNQDIDKRLARIGLATRDYALASLVRYSLGLRVYKFHRLHIVPV